MSNYSHGITKRQVQLTLSLILWTVSFFLPSEVHAYDPHLRLPWPATASYGITTGNAGYNCDLHKGADYYAIDFNLPLDREVDATQGGTVIEIGFQDFGFGRFIRIEHGNGFISRYAHLRDVVEVTLNQRVTQGQRLGLSGNTGKRPDTGEPVGPHLHLAAYLGGQAYMPEPMSTSGPVPVTGFGNWRKIVLPH